jgi:hypothetical protein
MKFPFLAVLVAVLCLGLKAEDYMQPVKLPHASEQVFKEKCFSPTITRPDSTRYSFSIAPENLLLSYYDYMIGSYNNCPVWKNPDPAYGGYFLAFHGKRTDQGSRKVFFPYIEDDGTIGNMMDNYWQDVWEGYPSLAIDPLSGKPMYAWHGNFDGTADTEYEVNFSYDSFISGSAGLMSDPETIINNPIPDYVYNTSDNEFLWPSVQIGPSPDMVMHRIYVLARNAQSHAANTSPSENVYIAYADFVPELLEIDYPFEWNYISIPMLDAWNNATDIWRRMSGAFVAGDDGNIYYIGYHQSSAMVDNSDIEEPDLDVYLCDNYGEGTWQRITGDSRYPGWNPSSNYGNLLWYFVESDGYSPIADDNLHWKLMNSSHFNAVFDSQNAEIHLPGLWTQYWTETVNGVPSSFFHPTFHTVKDLVFDLGSQTFSIREVYPQAGTSEDNLLWLPWDQDADGQVDEYYTNPDDPNDYNNGMPMMTTTWPFPHWDSTAHDDAMMYHYNNIKITQPDQNGNMACVWQDSNRARLYNTYPTDYPDLAPYADTPEIWISLSGDFGVNWSDPISLNKVETTQFADIKPMWVYPVNQTKSYGVNTTDFEGKLALMFYDDYSWGSYVISSPEGQNLGGQVKFMELSFTPVPNDDETAVSQISALNQNSPNPFTQNTEIKYVLDKVSAISLEIFNVKGQKIRTLVNDYKAKGSYTASWDATDGNNNSVSSGVYFYRLSDGKTSQTRKMLLLK